MTITQARISRKHITLVRCAAYHSGSHRLARVSGGLAAECQGCRTHYTAEQVLSASDGRTSRQLGQGGVTTA